MATNTITWRAVAAAFGTILLAGGGFYATTSDAKLTKLNDQVGALNKQVVALETQAGESEKRRIEQQEVLKEIRAGIDALREQVSELKVDLERRR